MSPDTCGTPHFDRTGRPLQWHHVEPPPAPDPPMTPAEVLGRIGHDPTSPRVTFYDDQVGPTRGERIELSARVLANWVSKAANLLQDDFDAEPGTRVGLDLPGSHWRTVYWALATWSVGATLDLVDPVGADVLITDDPRRPPHAAMVVVTLAGLARMCPNPLPAGAVDEAATLLTYPDVFEPFQQPDDGSPALLDAQGTVRYGELVRPGRGAPGRRVYLPESSEQPVVREVLDVLADDGSVVLVRDPDPSVLPGRLSAEGAEPGTAPRV